MCLIKSIILVFKGRKTTNYLFENKGIYILFAKIIMSNKNKKLQGIVYSTNPDYLPNDEVSDFMETLSPNKQNLLVRISTQGRGGKKATLVQRFVGSESDLENLGKDLKKHCGTGGTVKDGEIIIQGDLCQKVVDYLITKGYKARKG
jgi:translation initiation factor 1